MSRKLTLDDIADLRAYERERDEFRDRIIALKRDRRVSVGPLLTLVFENRDTVRFQVQEMARAEKLISDEQVQAELDVYNPLIPEPGSLSATLFVELTSKDELKEWLPKLVGIERSMVLSVDGDPIRCTVDEAHAEQLTRPEVTASVHYVGFELEPAQVDRFAAGPVTLAADHPGYAHGVDLTEATRRSLLGDLRS